MDSKQRIEQDTFIKELTLLVNAAANNIVFFQKGIIPLTESVSPRDRAFLIDSLKRFGFLQEGNTSKTGVRVNKDMIQTIVLFFEEDTETRLSLHPNIKQWFEEDKKRRDNEKVNYQNN